MRRLPHRSVPASLRRPLLFGLAGLVLLLADGGALSGRLVTQVVAEGEDGPPALDGYRTVNVVLVDHHAPACAAARRKALEVAPELLALADWPLDPSPPPECLTGLRPEAFAAATDDLLETVDIPERAAVVHIAADLPDNLLAARDRAARLPEADRQAALIGPQLAALDAATLDEVRGGFEMPDSGLKFSFGIERAVYLNGELVASTVLNLRDLRLVSATGVPGNGGDAAGVLGALQNGGGNNVATQISPQVVGTIIQNTLNDQRIQNVTTINASVNSLQAVRTLSVQTAIQQGILNSLRR